jgi:hypothetical protein
MEFPNWYVAAEAVHTSTAATPSVSHTHTAHGMKLSNTTQEKGSVGSTLLLPESELLLLLLPDSNLVMKALRGAVSFVSMISNTCGLITLDESMASISGLRSRPANCKRSQLWLSV